MYCSNCGKKLADGDYFCPNCGTPVSRQGLFDDEEDFPELEEEELEQTRIFDNEALQAVLHDDALFVPEEDQVEAEEPPVRSFARFLNDPHKDPRPFIDPQVSQPAGPADHQEEEEGPAYDSFVMGNTEGSQKKASGSSKLLGAVGAMTSLLHADKKEKQDESVQDQAEPYFDIDDHVNDMPGIGDLEEEDRPRKKEKDTSDSISMRKMILPIIVIGILIGLVAGMAIIQPWSKADNKAQAGTTGVVQTENMLFDTDK